MYPHAKEEVSELWRIAASAAGRTGLERFTPVQRILKTIWSPRYMKQGGSFNSTTTLPHFHHTLLHHAPSHYGARSTSRQCTPPQARSSSPRTEEQSPPPSNWEGAAATLSAMQHLHQLADHIVGTHPDALPLFNACRSPHQLSRAPFPWIAFTPGEFPYGLVRKALNQDSAGDAVPTRAWTRRGHGGVGECANRANSVGRFSFSIRDKAQLPIRAKALVAAVGTRNPMSERCLKENDSRWPRPVFPLDECIEYAECLRQKVSGKRELGNIMEVLVAYFAGTKRKG
ncbi:hypothetical protein C8J57DRAFT_1260371 [Mycena rebaudengoi]|nr:hypothetical protein C8J57DRAFT_1260371 [Mycena rebaudengoi]